MASLGKILIAEDDDLTLELLANVLEREGYEVVAVADGRMAIDRLRETKFDLVVSDIQMARASGLELLDVVIQESPDTPVVLVTAYADPGAAMDAIAKGAADYLAKPVDVVALRATVARALERRRLATDNRSLRATIAGRKVLVGTSPAMLELYKQIAHVAPTNATVHITGESGAGKELVARTIHERSLRAARPFVAVNCASLAEGLLESELFGHERGAFTGANTAHPGLFEAAEGGTIFLDEVGDVPTKMQAALLRVLQEAEVRRVGGSTVIKVDVRVISATNRDLAADVKSSRMREDLFYRLSVVLLRVPPLRDRGDDILALTQHLVARHAALLGCSPPRLSEEALLQIRHRTWPGNVRELDNALARAVAMSQRGVILPGDLPAVPQETPTASFAVDSGWPTLEELQRRYIERVLEHTGHNKTSAADILGIDRRTIQRLVAREHIAIEMEMTDSILSVSLRGEYERVGLPDQLIDRDPWRVDRHDADADGRGDAHQRNGAKSFGQFVEYPICGLVASLGEQQQELVATAASHDVARTHVALQRRGDSREQHITGLVATDVVYLLEVVDIEIGERERSAVTFSASELPRSELAERSAVEGTGQRIGPGQRGLVRDHRLQPGQNTRDDHEET